MVRISNYKILSFLLVVMVLLAQFAFLPAAAQAEEDTAYGLSAQAANLRIGQSSTKVKLTPHEGMTLQELQDDVQINLYKGYLPYFYEVDAKTAQGLFQSFLKEVDADNDGVYHLEKGIYSYYVRGDGYYSVIKVFIVSDNDITSGEKEVTIETGRIGGTLFEPDPSRKAGQGKRGDYDYIPSTAVIQSQEQVLCLWPDEILQHYTTDDLSSHLVSMPFNTPFFSTERALHQFTSQDEFMDFIGSLSSDNLYTFDLGKSPVYNYNMPILVYTTSDIPRGASLSRAAEIVSANDKPTVWHQAQIHPNEPASGEAALVIAQDLANDFGYILDDINVVLVPRINVDGSKIYGRYTAQGFDMNRDHLALKAAELVKLHGAYVQFMPEMTIDGHEYPDFFSLDRIYISPDVLLMTDSDDLQIDPATSLNNHPALTTFGIDAVQQVFDDAYDAGLRPNHYGTTVNNPIGRAYYGLYGSVSILVETKGIGAGSTAMDRRVYGQVLSMKSMYQYAADNSGELIEAVATAREEIVQNGRYYDEDDILVLHHGKSGNTMWPYGELDAVRFDIYGEANDSPSDLALEDQIIRSRPRPTAYVIPLGKAWSDKALYILENQGAEVYKLSAGTTIPVEQYYFEGAYGSKGDFTAGLHEEQAVTFPDGVAVIPMDQVAGNIIAMIMEPDVNDSYGFDGTLVQTGIVGKDANGDFPIYRYTQGNPRAALNLSSGYSSSGGGSSSSKKSGSMKADQLGGASAVAASTPASRTPVSQADVVAKVTEMLSTSSNADIVVKDASTVSAATLKAMAEAAANVNGVVRLLADTTQDGKVVGRLYITPALNTLDGDISLGVFPASQTVTAISNLFAKHFDNQVAVVELEHKGSFGMQVDVAVKVDLTGLDTSALSFYTYDQSANRYYRMQTTYFVDTNGYLHFTTETGGPVLITDSAMSSK